MTTRKRTYTPAQKERQRERSKKWAIDNPERVAARKKKVETATWDSKAGLVLEELFGKDHNFQRSD